MKLAENLVTTWDLFGVEEARWYQNHHAEVKALARYCEVTGKQNVTIVPDDSEGEVVRGMRAVTFTHNGETVLVRTVFDVQYLYE